MKASRITALGLVAAATLWILSGHFLPRETAESNAAIRTNESVATVLMQRVPISMYLGAAGLSVGLALGLSVAIVSALRPGSRIDSLGTLLAMGGVAIPSFWLGMVLLLLFGLKLGWLPFVGYIPFSESAMQAMLFLVMPVMTLTITESGVLTRMMRSSSIDVLQLDYVTHARAKGLSERVVLTRHVFPNAFAPTLTLVGLTLGHLLGGIAVIETVFTLPGLGRLMVDSVLARDYPVVQGLVLMFGTTFVAINLLVDLLYAYVDPRIHYT